MLILSNGAKTEVDYFTGLKLSGFPSPGKILTVKFRNGTPYDTVRSAIEVKEYSDFDEAWAVCDVDTFEVKTAIELANENGVGLALSQPCFEVWLIFHKTDKCPSFDNADQARRALRKLIPSWDKANLNFADFIEGIPDAVVRARKRDEPPEANPSTAVWRVIVSLGATSDADDSSIPSAG